MSFGDEYSVRNVTSFPLADDDAKIVAPFWNDGAPVSRRQAARYWPVFNASKDQEGYNLIHEIDTFLMESWNLSYSANWALVIQWTEACQPAALTCKHDDDKVRTFFANKC